MSIPKNDRASRKLTYNKAIGEALYQCMSLDNNVVVVGEGVPDPKAIFETTQGLREEYGPERVLDMPLSENGMTGICIGAALMGLRPILVHQRIDFALLTMDQLVNNAAKWHYMFNGQLSVPLVIRMIIGRGWGQGPQHSQSLQAIFSHIPGLKVVLPSNAYEAKGLLIEAIKDENPVIFIEHRWLYPTVANVPRNIYSVALDQARLVKEGSDITIAAWSYMVLESAKAASVLEKYGVNVELIDMRAARPLDVETVVKSVSKTKLLLVTDTGCLTGGVAGELLACVVEATFDKMKKAPMRIASPDYPVPTTHFLADDYYPDAYQIALGVLALLNQDGSIKNRIKSELSAKTVRDIPSDTYEGPF